MKKILFALVAILVLASCQDSTFLGLEEISFSSTGSDSGLQYGDVELIAQFDTTVNRLYTVEQRIDGVKDVVDGGEKVAEEEFSVNLDLGVIFSITPSVVYVAEEALLSNVEMVSETISSVSETEEMDESGAFIIIEETQSYVFEFNGGESVTATATWQSAICAVTGMEFPYASIESVSFDSFEATLDSTSNTDSTVVNVDLYFNVEVVYDGTQETYVVRVPEVRIFRKDGSMPEAPVVEEVVVENTDYEAAFSVATLSLVTDYQIVSGDLVTYRDNMEISRQGFERSLNLEALFTSPERVYVDSEGELISGAAIAASSRSTTTSSRSVDEAFTTTSFGREYYFRMNDGGIVNVGAGYQSLSFADTTFTYASVSNVSYNRAEVGTITSSGEEMVAPVTLYFNVEVTENGDNSSTTSTYEVAVPYERILPIEEEEDELIGKSYKNMSREILDANTERISFTEVESWSVSGEKTNTISLYLYRHFTEPERQDVYATNNSYNTSSNGSSLISEVESISGNWTVTTRYMQYTSTATNGVNPFSNIYVYDYQKAVYTDEYYTVEFGYANWSISEAGSSIVATSDATINGIVYAVSNYVNNINTVYSISTSKYESSASAEARIYVEKVIDKVIPESWGTIVGAGISAVPTDPNGGSAQKCLTIRTDKGAVAVPFSMSDNVPEVSNILSGYFVEGDFSAEYNSGFYTTTVNQGSYDLGVWAPAIAKDLSDRIAYYNGDDMVRNIRHSVLGMWGWRNGNYSTVVEGYIFSVSESGVLTITVNGTVVMQIR